MGIFKDIITDREKIRKAKAELATAKAGLDRIEKGMATKEDVSQVLSGMSTLLSAVQDSEMATAYAAAGGPGAVNKGQVTFLDRNDMITQAQHFGEYVEQNNGIIPAPPINVPALHIPHAQSHNPTPSIVCGDDIRYFAQQPQSELTLIVGQMTSLLDAISDTKNNTDTRVSNLQNQNWFKRMCFTITGKNKATKEEIRRNQDKMLGYISEAVAQLYKMNLIEMQVMQSLGNRINQVYSQLVNVYNEQLHMKTQITELQQIQYQTIQSLGEIANTLNTKIESIDNFHMLITEIQQKQYNFSNKILSICNIISQLDQRTMQDERKLKILKDALIQNKIISEKNVSLSNCLMEIISLPEDRIGTVYLELCNYRECFPSNVFADSIEAYHFLTKTEKLSQNKKKLIQSVINKYNLNNNVKFSYLNIYDNLVENKKNSIVDFSSSLLGMNV